MAPASDTISGPLRLRHGRRSWRRSTSRPASVAALPRPGRRAAFGQARTRLRSPAAEPLVAAVSGARGGRSRNLLSGLCSRAHPPRWQRPFNWPIPPGGGTWRRRDEPAVRGPRGSLAHSYGLRAILSSQPGVYDSRGCDRGDARPSSRPWATRPSRLRAIWALPARPSTGFRAFCFGLGILPIESSAGFSLYGRAASLALRPEACADGLWCFRLVDVRGPRLAARS
jgi:hypothetical protein